MEQIGRLQRRELTAPVSHSILEVEEREYDYLARSNRNAEESSKALIEGIWTGEIYGPYGWENDGTYVHDQGRVFGGNNMHYSAGHYSVIDDSYRAEIAVHYYGQPRAIFGERREQFEIVVLGTLNNGVIEAQIGCRDRPEFGMRYRMTRRAGLPSRNQ